MIVHKGSYLYIPGAFTPNDDNKNDVLKAFTNLTGYFKLAIFNTYGEKVFETTNISQGWDGNFKGKKQPMGTYVYVVEYESRIIGRQFEKGAFVLIR